MTVREYNRHVDEWSDGLFRFALSMCKDEDSSKDAVQDAFVKLWERKDNVDPAKVKSYLFTIVHHRLIDGFRYNKRHDNIDSSPVNAVETQASHDLQKILHGALDNLPEMQKSVILLRDYEGYNYEEIAAITGLNLSQVKVYIFRGRQRLKQFLGSIESLI